MDKPQIAVEVLTYNSDLEKLKLTLNSILIQKNIDFEIIIADDGSKNFNEKSIRQFFEDKDFEKYTIVANKQNQGTVKNVISGLEKVTADYVKDISPGDMFYDENTLYDFYQEIQKSNEDVYFGNACYYNVENQIIHFYNPKNPRNINVYKKTKVKQIKKNYLNKRDYILGANFLIKTSVFLEYLKKIEDKVVYAEDCSFIYMLADNIIPVFFDRNFIWYEYGSGISTSSNNSWIQKIEADNKSTFELLYQNRLISKACYDMKYSKSFIKKLFLRILLNPMSLIRKILPIKISEIERDDKSVLVELLNK